MSNLVYKAMCINQDAHAGQEDKGGRPYFLHPQRVAGIISNRSREAIATALLHDVIEDTSYTFDDLREEGISEEVIAAVDALSKRKDESYNDYLGRVSENQLAVEIKLADILDNMDTSRLKLPLTQQDIFRLDKYRKAYEFLEGIKNEGKLP